MSCEMKLPELDLPLDQFSTIRLHFGKKRVYFFVVKIEEDDAAIVEHHHMFVTEGHDGGVLLEIRF